MSQSVKNKIKEFLKTPRTILECNNQTIGTNTTNKKFHECWVEMVDSGEIKFTEGGKNRQPILCYVESESRS